MSDDDIDVRLCTECGIRWGAPLAWWKARQEDKKTFYCPNGHACVFRESDADRLRRELDRAKQNAAYLEDRIKSERENTARVEYRRRALAGQVTKLKKRTAAGVCPCCNRSFSQLARHMNEKHPGFVAEPLADNVIPIDRTGS